MAAGEPAQVEPTPRAIATRSASTAAAAAGPPAPGPSNATRPTGTASTSTRLSTPSQRPNGEPAGTAVATTDASIAPSSASRVVATRRRIRPSAASAATSPAVTPVIPGAPARPEVVPGRLPTAAGSIQAPNASRARITSLLRASRPSTSAVGSASAYPRACASARTSA